MFSGLTFNVSEKDFLFDVKDVAIFRVIDGNKVLFCPYSGADQKFIELILNGSVAGAVLHQQQKLPFHGDSFVYKNKGVIICGCSGSGKSAVTAAFCKNGAQLISDDISPISFRDMDIFLEPLKTKMKLWDDSIKELDISNECLKRIRPALNKYYVPHQTDREKHQLDRLIILGVHNQPDYRTQKLFEFEKYNALRSQIYRKLYLKGMPETEKKYFKQLLQIAQSIDVTMVWRPKICKIHETMDFIKETLAL